MTRVNLTSTQHSTHYPEPSLIVGLPPTEDKPVDISEVNRSITVCGITLSGVSIEDLEQGQIKVTFPMKAGQFSFPGLAQDLQLVVRDSTLCTINIQITRINNEPKIQEAKLSFSRTVRIKNPAKALQTTGQEWLKELKDTFVDVAIRSVAVDKNGLTQVDGCVKVFGFIDTALPADIISNIPKLDLSISTLLDAHKKRFASSEVTAARLLKELSCMTSEGAFNVSLTTRPVSFSAQKGNNAVRTASEPVSFSTSGRCSFTHGNDLTIKLPKEQTRLSTGAVDVSVSGDAHLSLTSKNDFVLESSEWEGVATGKSALISIDGLKIGFDGIPQLFVAGQHSALNITSLTGHAEGYSSFNVQMSEWTRRNYPKVKTFEQGAYFELYDDGTAKIYKTNNGFSEFVAPFTPIAGWPFHLPDPFGCYDFSIDSPEFQSLVEKSTGATIHPNSQVVLLPDGVSSMPERLKMIREAKEFICLQTHVFKDDDVSTQIADALIEAANRGVKVYVIVDSIGNAIDSIGEDITLMLNERPIYQKLRNGGIQLGLYNDKLEKGLRQLLQIINERPEIAQIKSLNELRKPKTILRSIHRMALAARGELPDVEVTESDKQRFRLALNDLFNEVPGSEATVLMEDLKRMSENDTFSLSEILALTERIPNIHVLWHEKILVTEKGSAILGGMNVAKEYLGSGPTAYRDNDNLISGPAVRDILTAFEKNWLVLRGETLAPLQDKLEITEFPDNGKRIQIIHHRPAVNHDHHLTSLLIHALKTLKPGEKVYVEQAYVLLTGTLENLKIALCEAAKRGVDVRIYTNSTESSDVHTAMKSNIFCFRDLLASGVRIFEQKGTRTIHSKVCTLGSKMAIVGSENWENRSGSIDNESSSITYDADYARQLERRIEEGFDPNVSKEIRLEDIERLPFATELANVLQSSVDDVV